MTTATPTPPQKPALADLTPMEANRIVTHYVHTVHPELRPLEIKPSRQRLVLPGFQMEMLDIGFSSEFSQLASAHFGTHFLDAFDGLTPNLDLLCRVLTMYALASTGEVELTEKNIDACQTVLKHGWGIIDEAKRSGAPYVRHQAQDLETVMLEFFERKPGEKFYATRSNSMVSR